MSSFTKKLKAAGLPKLSAKVSTMKDFKTKSIKTPKVKESKVKEPKPFDFKKYTKIAKLPKSPKIALIKKAIKKTKNVGF